MEKLNVTPQELKNKVEEMRTVMSDLNNLFNNRYDELCGSIQNMWTGKAADKYLSKYQKVHETTLTVFADVASYADVLNNMAENYEQAENVSMDAIASTALPTIF